MELFLFIKKGEINKFIDNIIENKTVEVFGDITTSSDYIHSNDIVKGIYLCIKNCFFLNSLEQITITCVMGKKQLSE